jgi:hypothetical protein
LFSLASQQTDEAFHSLFHQLPQDIFNGFQVNEKMYEQCAARIVTEVDTIDDLAMGMLAHNLTDKHIKQAY